MNSIDYIGKLTGKRVSWLVDSGPKDDIAISTRIRIARNLKDTPFPPCADSENLNKVVVAATFALDKMPVIKKQMSIDMGEIGPVDAQVLLERRLISQEFCARRQNSSLVMSDLENIAVMINEEDHIRLQVIRPGLQIPEVWEEINSLETALSNELPFEFDQTLGFLTSCPTNVGTGMRASVMLHLPGLVLSNQTNQLIQAISKLGLAVRGIFGEGTDNLGNLFQVSNQSTLGETEEDIVTRLSGVISQIVKHEKNVRIKLLEKQRDMLLDHIGRSYGILKYSYIISTKEALNSLSMLRLGIDLGIIRSVDMHTVNELFICVQPAHLQKYAGKNTESEGRDRIRATFIRDALQKNNG
ncbi:MAG: protein arginine kinase [Victivallales bacterium]|nr:protein arginine kinase [Victivallales bacterium]